MRKICLFFFIFLGLLPVPVLAEFQTHQDFVYSSEKEQREFAVKLMELMVELEKKYEKDTKTYGFSPVRLEKFLRAISIFQEIFGISSAIAVPIAKGKLTMQTWEQYAQAFQDNLSRSRAGYDVCIYAGWVSRVVTDPTTNKIVCNHPDSIPKNRDNSLSPFSAAYPDPKGKSKCDPTNRNQIQCNPAIFGFKNAQNGSLFCVDASNRALNSSYLCMQKALSESKEDPTDNSKDERLKLLVDKLQANPESFKRMQKFIFQTCLCDGEDFKTNEVKGNRPFSLDYQNYMRPHRTCYGLMEMLSATNNKCSDGSPILLSADIFNELRKAMGDSIFKSQNDSDIEEKYKGFITSIKSSQPTAYNNSCNPNANKNYTCSATCEEKTAGGNKTIECKDYKFKEGDTDVQGTGAKPKGTIRDLTGEFMVEVTIAGVKKDVSCTPTVNTPPVVYSCEAECVKQPDNKYKCSYVFKKGETEVKPDEASKPTEVQDKIDQALTLNVGFGGQKQDVTCKATDKTPAEKKYACNANCTEKKTEGTAAPSDPNPRANATGSTPAPAAKIYACTYAVTEEGQPNPVATTSGPEANQSGLSNGASKEFEFTIGQAKQKISCKFNITQSEPEVAPPTEVTLTVKTSNLSDTTAQAEATIVNGEGWMIDKWEQEASDALKAGFEIKAPTPEGVAVTGRDSESAAITNRETGPGKGKIINVPRLAENYQVCVTIKKGEETKKECGTIAKKEKKDNAPSPSAKPSGGFDLNSAPPQAPQPMPRGPSDASALGVK